MKLRLRRVGVGLLVAAALVAAGLWLARDLPRRQVERALAERLRGEVRVGRLQVNGLREAVVEGLEVRRTALLPQLESLTVQRVEASGPLLELAGGRFERLRLVGLEAVLTPDPGRPVLEPATLEIGLLEVAAARITLRAAGDSTTLVLDADLRDVGGAVNGEVRVAGPRLDLATLYAVSGAPGELPARIALEEFEVTAGLAADGEVELSAGADAVRIRRGARQVTLDRPHVEAHATRTDGQVLVTVVPELTALGPSRIELAFALNPLRLEHLDARASALELAPWVPSLPGGVELAGMAEIAVEGSPTEGFRTSVVMPRANIRTPAGTLATAVHLSGTLALDGGNVHGPVEVTVELAEGTSGWPSLLLPASLTADGEATLGTRSRFAGRVELATAAAGTAALDGAIAVADQESLDLAWRWQGGDVADLVELAAAAGVLDVPAGYELEGSLAAHGVASGTIRAPAVTAEVAMEHVRARATDGDSGWSTAVPRAVLQLAWKPTTRSLAVSLPATAAVAHLPPLEPLELQLGAEGSVEPSARFVRLDRLELEVPGVGVHATGSGGGATPFSAQLHVDVPEVERLRATLRPLLDTVPDDLALAGAATADLAISRTPAGAWSASGPVALRQAGFMSADGARVAEGLSGALELDAAASESTLRARAIGDAGGFQLLWGTLFGDWSETRFGLELELDAERPGVTSAWSGQAGATLTSPGGLRLAASVERAPDRPLGWSAELTADDLAAVLEGSVQGPLAGSLPSLEGMTATGGIAARIEGSLDQGAGSARGRVHVADVTLRVPELEIRGLDADLPVDLTWSRPDPAAALSLSGPRQLGSLRFAAATAGGLSLPTTAAGLVVEADRVTLDQSLAIPLLGGQIELAELALADLARPTRHLATSVQLRGVSLAEASRALGVLPLEGSLDGAFPRVRLTPETLYVDGVGQLALFGGRIEFSSISGRDVLGRYPRLLFNARVAGLDLARLTQTFDFGRVTGILAGEVAGCELFRGVPVRFAAELRTVAVPGVKQRISLKAVNNIAVVGTGSGIGNLGSGLLRRFISSYPYEAFGALMVLDEDRFLLRGLERRGDRELFLRGRFPFRLDVVNVDPGSTVSFRTMIDRLRNLDFSGAQTQP